MKKVRLDKGVMKLHYKAPQRIVERATQLANTFLAGGISSRKLTNGKGSVIDVNPDNRIVIDSRNNFHLLEHQQYNTFIVRNL